MKWLVYLPSFLCILASLHCLGLYLTSKDIGILSVSVILLCSVIAALCFQAWIPFVPGAVLSGIILFASASQKDK